MILQLRYRFLYFNVMSSFIIFLVFLCSLTGSEDINMKIVEEPSSYGFNNFNAANPLFNADENNKLKMRVNPANFSGPLHMKRLNNKCFTKNLDVYKYEFCPFSNVTQQEQSYRWNPYSGVLGVWQEWEISNNTFVAMVMREGDKCGDIFRSVKVVFECGKTNEILNVTEYKTCHYKLVFSTPHACPAHALLVYPTLTSDLRNAWDIVEGQYERMEITQKGYNKRLQHIFEEAGYYMSKQKQSEISKKAVEKETQVEQKETGDFDTLNQCTEEYKKLKKEIEGLRALLALKDDPSNNQQEKPDTAITNHSPGQTNKTISDSPASHNNNKNNNNNNVTKGDNS